MSFLCGGDGKERKEGFLMEFKSSAVTLSQIVFSLSFSVLSHNLQGAKASRGLK